MSDVRVGDVVVINDNPKLLGTVTGAGKEDKYKWCINWHNGTETDEHMDNIRLAEDSERMAIPDFDLEKQQQNRVAIGERVFFREKVPCKYPLGVVTRIFPRQIQEDIYEIQWDNGVIAQHRQHEFYICKTVIEQLSQ